MHRAPVVGIVVLDGHGAPLPEPLEVAHDLARSPEMQGSHHLLVISEEQFKVGITSRQNTVCVMMHRNDCFQIETQSRFSQFCLLWAFCLYLTEIIFVLLWTFL